MNNENNNENISFEQAYERLKDASDKLDRDDISLEEAMKSYEEGVKHYKLCISILDEAKQKIEMFNSEEE